MKGANQQIWEAIIAASISLRVRIAGVFAAVMAVAAPAVAEMRLTSSELAEGHKLAATQVLAGMGCSGGNLSPSLSWSGAPQGTKSFIVTLYDPDAPTGSGFWHWSVFDIPGDSTGLDAGKLPLGAVAARNDFSQNGYAGACPPAGQTHRYIFSVYAMPQAKLPIDETASAAMVGFFATTSALASARISAEYGR